MDGVAKLGSNMYFYTGPGGAESPPSLHSDDEDQPVNEKKAESEPARKSGRAGKGRNPRLEREDEVVDISQVKVGNKGLSKTFQKVHKLLKLFKNRIYFEILIKKLILLIKYAYNTQPFPPTIQYF